MVARPLPPLWTLAVVQLDTSMFDYRPADIAAILNITVQQARHYCNDLWPSWPGQYLMDFDHAAILLYRICRGARKMPSRSAMFERLMRAGVVGETFPEGDPRVQRAMKAIAGDREQRIARRLGDKLIPKET